MTDAKPVQISDDCELDHYVRALTSSSNRTRYIMVIATIVSILLLVASRNAGSGGWMDTRIETAILAIKHQLWTIEPDALDEYLDGARVEDERTRQKIKLIHAGMPSRALQSADDLRRVLSELERAEVDYILHPTVPFLGLRFDVNDLGVFGGLSMVILMLLLLSSISGEYENVRLAMWKVRRVAEQEEAVANGSGIDNNNSRANLLYHALAMAQVLSRPPTLIRWRTRWGHAATKILFLAPLLVQLSVFWHDFSSRKVAAILNPSQTRLNLALSGAALVVLALSIAICLIYSRALDREWKSTFFTINPERRKRPQESWARYVRLLPERPDKVSIEELAAADAG